MIESEVLKMKFTKITAVMFFLLTPIQVYAETLDPVVISPDYYQLKFENEYVRAVEYKILPGEKEKWHTHPAKIAYVLSGGKLKVTTDNGESFVVDEGVGEVRWLGAVGKHYGENVGDTPIHIIFFEIKGADQSASDLTRYLKEETGNGGKQK